MKTVAPRTMEEVQAVIDWLDEELEYLVDEHGVLKVTQQGIEKVLCLMSECIGHMNSLSNYVYQFYR